MTTAGKVFIGWFIGLAMGIATIAVVYDPSPPCPKGPAPVVSTIVVHDGPALTPCEWKSSNAHNPYAEHLPPLYCCPRLSGETECYKQ